MPHRMTFSAPVMVAVLAVVAAAPAVAQQAPGGQPVGPPAQAASQGPRVIYGTGRQAPAIVSDPDGAGSSGIVDESALRYYASQKQTARVKAEIARIKRLNPGWTEPNDLDSLKPSPPDEAPLWDLFAAGRIADLRKVIAARQAGDPGWQPSIELASKLRRAEFRNALRAASRAGDDEVLDLYKADPAAIDPTDVESLWTVADSLAASGIRDESYQIYRRALDASSDPGARLATIQKAMAHLRMEDAERLIALGRQTPDGKSEFDPIRIDITRARIAAFLHDEPANTPTASDIAEFETYARKNDDPSQTGLLGWYAYKRRQFREALDWFKNAISHGGDAMIAHGLAHTLRELNLMRDAEEVAYAWRNKFVGNELLFIDILERKLTLPVPPFIEPARIDRYAAVTALSASGEGAQGLAWYAYNTCQFDKALEWFQRAVAWLPSETTVFGYALTLQRLRRQPAMLEIVNRYDGLFAKVVDLVFQEASGPPTPCDPPSSHARAASAARSEVQTFGRVPAPGSAAATGRVNTIPPAVQRKEFPLPVAPENPLRYPTDSVARLLAEPVRAGTYLAEAAPAPQLIARRVPGADPMPYERYGFALLPSYTGSQKAEALSPPADGTLWQEQQRQESSRNASADLDRFAAPGRDAPAARPTQ